MSVLTYLAGHNREYYEYLLLLCRVGISNSCFSPSLMSHPKFSLEVHCDPFSGIRRNSTCMHVRELEQKMGAPVVL